MRYHLCVFNTQAMDGANLLVLASDAQPALSAATELTDSSSFATSDWLVLGGYFAIIAISGIILSRKKQKDTDDYFLGGRQMPAWAVAMSIVATSLSAATFIGGPQQSYVGDLTYLSVNIGVAIAVLIVAFGFIPAFYRHNVSTVYELLERQVGRSAKQAASVMFMVGRVFASGTRLFIVAIPAALILFGEVDSKEEAQNGMRIAIAAMAGVGILYTLVGGIRSVIWTDVLQLIVFVGAAGVALWVLWSKIPLDFDGIVDALENPAMPGADAMPSKLNVLPTGFEVDSANPSRVTVNFGETFTLITAMTGFVLLNIAAYGTDQDMAQRMLTCRNSAKGGASVLLSVFINVPITALFLAVGLGLFIFYQRPDLMGDAAPSYEPIEHQKIFATFIVRELPSGMKGVLMAGLFAAGLSSLNSALNAMSSAMVSDVYKHVVKRKSAAHYLLVGRIGVVVWGVILAGFAMLCVQMYDPEKDTLINFALSVMVLAYSGLAAVFLITLFTKRGNTVSVIAALITGFVITLWIDPSFWSWVATANEDNASVAKFCEERVRLANQFAFPWRMFIATTAAMLVCLLGKRSAASGVNGDAAKTDDSAEQAVANMPGEDPNANRRPI